MSAGFLSKVLNWPIRGIWLLFRALLIAWATLAIYYSNLPSAGLRLALAMVFVVVATWLLWLSRNRRAFVVFVVLFLGVRRAPEIFSEAPTDRGLKCRRLLARAFTIDKTGPVLLNFTERVLQR